MSKLRVVESLGQRFRFIVANNDSQKRQAYLLRFQHYKKLFPSLKNVEQVIDQYDASGVHLLLMDVFRDEMVATIRLNSKSSPSQQLPYEYSGQTIWIGDKTIAQLDCNTYSEISRLCIDQNKLDSHDEKVLVTNLMYLGAYSLSRLRFDDFSLLDLPQSEFKRLRAIGMMLEHTSQEISFKDNALYWVSSEEGIFKDSLIYDLYQHVLGEMAHQLNPISVEEDANQISINQ